jgi:hypothetical protein
MPPRDHFHPPWSEEDLWEGFHSAWKDRPENRQAFVAKCAGYLREQVSVVVVDVVTTRRANLHQETHE